MCFFSKADSKYEGVGNVDINSLVIKLLNSHDFFKKKALDLIIVKEFVVRNMFTNGTRVNF